MTIYFYWQQTMSGEWWPRCSHGEEPAKLKISDGDPNPRSTINPVPADCIDGDGSPNFGKLTKRFPLGGAK
jgi:hypothetical protein